MIISSTRRLISLFLLLGMLSATAVCQEKKTTEKVVKPPAAAPIAKKASNENSCDGALDIVPSHSATFVRKRRPARSPLAPAEPKAEKKIQR